MKIVRERLNEKFEQESDPIKDMNIGDPEKSLFPLLKKELKKFNIDIVWGHDLNTGDDSWYWYINVGFNLDYEEERKKEVEMIYMTDNAAASYSTSYSDKEEHKGGFTINDAYGSREFLAPTHDYNEVIKTLVRIKYGTKTDIMRTAKELQQELAELKNALKIMKNYDTPRK